MNEFIQNPCKQNENKREYLKSISQNNLIEINYMQYFKGCISKRLSLAE